MKLQVQKLHESAVLPQYAHIGDAGLDLYTSESFTLSPNERKQVKTGIALAIPDGYVGLVWDKSGLSHKSGLKTLGGVVDSGYRGEILVGLVNLSDDTVSFTVGQKIAQLLIQQVTCAEVEEVAILDETVRGTAGFGSTGS